MNIWKVTFLLANKVKSFQALNGHFWLLYQVITNILIQNSISFIAKVD